jgi:hypothetical protein
MTSTAVVTQGPSPEDDCGLEVGAQHNAATSTEQFSEYQENTKGLGIYVSRSNILRQEFQVLTHSSKMNTTQQIHHTSTTHQLRAQTQTRAFALGAVDQLEVVPTHHSAQESRESPSRRQYARGKTRKPASWTNPRRQSLQHRCPF